MLFEEQNLLLTGRFILAGILVSPAFLGRIRNSMRQHLATFVEDFQRHGQQTAMVTYPGNRRVVTSYADLARMAGRFSRFLAQSGLHPGDRVLLWGANSAEWVAAFFGCVLRGVIAVPLDAAGGAEFAAAVIRDTSPRLLVGDSSLLGKLSSAASPAPASAALIALQDFSAALPLEPLWTPEPSLAAATPLQVLYTSGTTSAPKGIVHTHGNVLASVEVLEREINKYRRFERWVHPLRILHTLPLSHVFGQFMGLWVPPLLAAPVHYQEKLVAGHLIELIHRERISVAAVVPRLLGLMQAQLLAEDAVLAAEWMEMRHRHVAWRWWHLRRIHRRFGWKFWAFVSGGAALPEETEQFWNALGFVLIQGYGMTETTALATLNHPLRPAQGSIGKPLAGREVRFAEDGEILVRGPMLAAGNWRNGQIEPRTDEWLHTGDLGSIDAQGQMHFVGRKSDVIVAASGMNIHPADLEARVCAQPGVRECAVVGWNSPHGPEPVAVVRLDTELGPSQEQNALAEILRHANQELQEYQRISAMLRWPGEEFPRNTLGKLLRRQIADWASRALQPEGSSATTLVQDPLIRLLEQVLGGVAIDADDAASLTSDLHLDSLGRMQLALGIEEQFGVPVGDDALAKAETIGDLRRLTRMGPQTRALEERRIAPGSSGDTRSPETTNARSIDQQRVRTAINYPQWPWTAPVHAVRVIFLEAMLRPLVAMLARPRVVRTVAPLPEQPSIYICNHVTSMDVPLVLYGLPRRIRTRMAVAMSAELLAAWRSARRAAGVGPGPLRWLAPLQAVAVTALFNVFPLPSGAGLRRSFAHAGHALDRGYNVLVFPEGQRTLTGDLQPFQTGISLLAQESQTAVVPCALIGLHRNAARDGVFRRRTAPIAMVIGEPMTMMAGESHAAFAARLRMAVAQLISRENPGKRF